MFHRFVRLSLRAGAIAATAAWIGVQSWGSLAVAATLNQQQISQFLANPASILTPSPNGGARLVSMVRDLLVSAPDADKTNVLNALIALLANANTDQQSAMGSGFGQAAQALLRTNPDFANQIQTALANSNNQTAIASYSATTGNTVIGSTGGGGGGGGGGPVGNGPPSGGGGAGGGGGGGGNTFAGGGSGGGFLSGANGTVTPTGGGGGNTIVSPH